MVHKTATEGEAPLVYDVPYVSRILGISVNHAYRMAHEEKFPAIRLGRRFVIPAEAFDRWLASAGQG